MAKIPYGKRLSDLFGLGFFIDEFWTDYEWYSTAVGKNLNTILFLRHSNKIISNAVIDSLNSDWVVNINSTPAFQPEPGIWQNIRFVNSAVQLLYSDKWNRLYNEYLITPTTTRKDVDHLTYEDTKTVDLKKTSNGTNKTTGTEGNSESLNNTTDYNPTVIHSVWGVNSGSSVNQNQDKTTSQAKDVATRTTTRTPNLTETANGTIGDRGTVKNSGLHERIKNYEDKPQFELQRDFFISQDYTFYERIIDDVADYLFMKIYDGEDYI